MNDTTKNSLKAALVLVVITAVAVTALVLANAFMPKYSPKLDLVKVGQIQAIAPSGVSDADALGGGYYSVYANESKTDNFDLSDFNKTNGNSNNLVLAVYFAGEGASKGAYIVETSTVGYNSQVLIMLTAFDAAGIILGVNPIEFNNQDFYKDGYAKLSEAVKGKSAVVMGDLPTVTTSTGATTGSSKNATLRNFELSVKAFNAVKGGV